MLLQRALIRPYSRIRSVPFVWRNILNREAVNKFHAHPPTLDKTQEEILDTLTTDGIVITDTETLFPGTSMLEKLQEFEQALRPHRKISPKKEYISFYWDTQTELDLSNPFVEASIHPRVLAIVNSYMDMFTRLTYYRLEQTKPVGENAERSHSQRWHRDPNEGRYVKMFIYLNDVDASAGPFTYIPKSTRGNTWGHLFPQRPPQGSYPDATELRAAIPTDHWLTVTGKAGSVILCDTTGLHRGGFATTSERLMFTAQYAANSYTKQYDFSVPTQLQETISELSPAQRYALRSES